MTAHLPARAHLKSAVAAPSCMALLLFALSMATGACTRAGHGHAANPEPANQGSAGASDGEGGSSSANGDRAEYSHQQTGENAMQQTGDNATLRYYQVVFIWMKDPPKFSLYMEQMVPIVQRYGGSLERMVLPKTIYAEGVKQPDFINIVYYDNKQAFERFQRDPEFEKIRHLRSDSIDMLAVNGVPLRGGVIGQGLADRAYTIEIARFGSNGIDGYRRYEEEAERVMQRYGYHVERVLAPEPEGVPGLPFKPDVVKIAYFDKSDGMDRIRRDPAHRRIEDELYPAAVKQSVWVIGTVHPSSLAEVLH